ncbi:hypothetical protein PC128_g25929 [Phytophthora cactorum]|nr:hypothetical protein PC128_g25929 [Phytophthora cactorum]
MLRRKNLSLCFDKGVNNVDELEESKEDEKKDELKKILRAKEILFDCMTENIMKTVKHESTPYRIFERLKKRFVWNTYFKYVDEMTKLRNLRLAPDANVAEHLGEVRQLMNRIALLGKPVDEYMKPALLIGTLPPEYESVVGSSSQIFFNRCCSSPASCRVGCESKIP